MQKLIYRNPNGDEIDFTSGDFGITDWKGFSHVDMEVQSQQVPFQDGSVFLDALLNERDLSITVAINDDSNLHKRYELKRQMIHILNPKLGQGELIYTNDFLSKKIVCVPNIPEFSNKNSNDSGTMKASCSFTANQPYWEDVNPTVVNINLGEVKSVENTGDVPVQVEIEFIGGAQNPKIKNVDTGNFIKWKNKMQNPVFIDTNTGKKKVVSESLKFNTISYSNTINDILYVNDFEKFFACANGGIILTSSDGINWTENYIHYSTNFYSIAYSSKLNLFVAVGSGGKATSLDGENWTYELEPGINYYSIIYSEEQEKFVIVGSNATILTSSDGINWTQRSSGVSSSLRSVTYSSNLNLFVIVGGSGNILTSSDGTSWTQQSSGLSSSRIIQDVVYSNKLRLLVAISNSGSNGIILTSSDGINWTENDLDYTGSLLCVTYSEDENYFISGSDNGTILTSVDGTNWVKKVHNFLNNLRCVAYSNKLNIFIAVGDRDSPSTTCFVYISSDGINWTEHNLEISNAYLNSIVYSEEQEEFVIVGSNGIILTSSDGINWVSRNSGISSSLNSVTYSSNLNLFVAVGDNVIMTSPDGINWTNRISDVLGLCCVIYCSELNLFVAVGGYLVDGDSEIGTVFTSTDGINWTQQILNISNIILRSVTYSSNLNLFVAVSGGGYGGKTLTSTDGINWENITQVDGGRNLYSITYSRELNLFVVVGDGVIMVSPDGYWNENVFHQINGNLYSVIYSERLRSFIIVGDKNLIINSELIQNQNVIEYITEDSDMNFSLDVGQNNLKIFRSSGSLKAVLRFTQKYLGV